MNYVVGVWTMLRNKMSSKTIIKYNDTNKKIYFFTARYQLIKMFKCSFLDINENKKINILYIDPNIKFRTITYGNIKKIRQKISEIKNNEHEIKMPNEIIIKDICFINNLNVKTSIKKLLDEYIEYDYEIKINDIFDNNILYFYIEYYYNYKLYKKTISIQDISDTLISELINTVINLHKN